MLFSGRQVNHDSVANLFARHAFRDEADVVDCSADGLIIGGRDDTWRRITSFSSTMRVIDHRLAVVRYEDPALSECPRQNFRVRGYPPSKNLASESDLYRVCEDEAHARWRRLRRRQLPVGA
jgi:hypothetical protein